MSALREAGAHDVRGVLARAFPHVDTWIVLFVLVAFGPIVQELTAQPASRIALTAAVAEHHTVSVAGYPLGVDRVTLADGRLRSDKAPGQPFLAIPVYAAGRALGFQPAAHDRTLDNLGLWWITLWSTVLPLCVLTVLMRRTAASLGASAPIAGALSITFATTMTAFSAVLYAHVLAATFAFGAWYVLRRAAPERPQPWLVAGALTGAAVVTEYTTLLLALLFTAFVLWKARTRLGWFVLGALPFGVAAGLYNQSAFGKPWRVSYGVEYAARGVHGRIFGVGVPSLTSLGQLFFDERGFLLSTPIVLVAVAFAISLVRRPGPARIDAVVGLIAFTTFLLMQAGWPNPWGGESPGPRYMIPALPFLAVPLAMGWKRAPFVARAAAAWGAVCMGAATLAAHGGLVPDHTSLFTWWVHEMRTGDVTSTLWTMALGNVGWIVYAAIVVAVGVNLVRVADTRNGTSKDARAIQPRAALV